MVWIVMFIAPWGAGGGSFGGDCVYDSGGVRSGVGSGTEFNSDGSGNWSDYAGLCSWLGIAGLLP
eukprot:9998884-Karenia_brevis.AAC.1